MAQINGTNHLSDDVSNTNIQHALEVVHNPSTDNDVRKPASDYLEQLKNSQNAYEYGLTFGADRTQPPLVRHFGLSLLEHVVRQLIRYSFGTKSPSSGLNLLSGAGH